MQNIIPFFLFLLGAVVGMRGFFDHDIYQEVAGFFLILVIINVIND
jgi:hypothetical protein